MFLRGSTPSHSVGLVKDNIAKISAEYVVYVDETLPAIIGVVPKLWLKIEIALSPPHSGGGSAYALALYIFDHFCWNFQAFVVRGRTAINGAKECSKSALCQPA